jgi:hypothetical protein
MLANHGGESDGIGDKPRFRVQNKPVWEVGMIRCFSVLGVSLALVLGMTAAAAAQNTGRLTTKSYQPIGKQKLQVDLTQVDAGELYRELRDYLKEQLERRGNPVGSSGAMGVKMQVAYVRPIESGRIGPERDLPSDNRVPGYSSNSPIPESRSFAPERRNPYAPGVSGEERTNPLRINITIYREGGGAVAWTAEASCAVAFVNAKDVGRAMIDQMIARLDSSVSLAAECGS